MFLATGYEEGRNQAELESDAAQLVSHIRSELFRNVQTLQSLHSVAPTVDSWATPAAELLSIHREMVRLEWRSNTYALLVSHYTPYRADPAGESNRERALPDVRQACESAQRFSGPAFSPSYFWPLSAGLGLELMEMCLPVLRGGVSSGFLVVTYSLTGLLSELANKTSLQGRGLAFTKPDGTRLALHSTVSHTQRVQHVSSVLDLPGHTLMLRMESQRPTVGLFPNVLTAVVGALSLALLAVLALLGNDMRRRQRAELDVANALAFRKAMENSLVTGLPAPWWPPELVDEYQQRMAVRLAGQTLPRERFESVFQRSDGTRFPVPIIEAPLIDAQGVQTGYMSAILDLTEQRRVEDINRTSQDRLQATARLATVGEMASLLRDELNQPLAAIASYATDTLNLLQDAAQPTAQAERAGRVIKSVADFVRRREPVAPQSLIDAIAPLLGLQAKKQGIRVQVDVAPGVPQVLCDRTMVE